MHMFFNNPLMVFSLLLFLFSSSYSEDNFKGYIVSFSEERSEVFLSENIEGNNENKKYKSEIIKLTKSTDGFCEITSVNVFYTKNRIIPLVWSDRFVWSLDFQDGVILLKLYDILSAKKTETLMPYAELKMERYEEILILSGKEFEGFRIDTDESKRHNIVLNKVIPEVMMDIKNRVVVVKGEPIYLIDKKLKYRKFSFVPVEKEVDYEDFGCFKSEYINFYILNYFKRFDHTFSLKRIELINPDSIRIR